MLRRLAILGHRSARPGTDRIPQPGASSPRALPTPTLIFLHIPKTGGISLRSTLLTAVAPHPTFRILHPINDHAMLAAMPIADRRALALVEGHMYYGVHEVLPRPATYITLLRDPLARLRSFHRYVSRERWHPFHPVINGEGLSLSDCVARALTTELDNYMTRSLTSLDFANVPFGAVTPEMLALAKARLDSIQLVGLTERLDDFYSLLCKHLSWPNLRPPHLNRTSEATEFPAGRRRGGINTPVGIDEDSDEGAILRLNRFDTDLVAHASRLLDNRLAALGIASSSSP